MPELSIIVPVYKVEKYLHKCIDSILAQTFNDFELILIDDGSPDRCGEICDEYAAKDPRIRVIHKENQGVSAARNAGLDVATGTYIGFVDSDDWIEPEMYETLLTTAKRTGAETVICGIRYCGEDGSIIRSDLTSEGIYSKDASLKALYGTPNELGGGCWNKIFLRGSVQDARFRKGISMAEDWLFLFECFKRCESFVKISPILYNLVERHDSATRANEINALYDIIFGGKASLLIVLARDYSHELECIAVNKYMDDCIRYSNLIREIGKKQNVPYRLKYLHIRFQILKQMPRAIFHRLLTRNQIHGYLYTLLRNK